MASKVKLSVKLNLDHELGADHYETWLSQLRIAFQLNNVTSSKEKYLAAAVNLDENASHYLWQKYPNVPSGIAPFTDLQELFEEYFGGKVSQASRLAELFSVTQKEGEAIQAFRHRIQKEMRVCQLNSSATKQTILDTVGFHLFARGLQSTETRIKVLECDVTTLDKAAEVAQTSMLAAQAAQEPNSAGSTATVAYTQATRGASRERHREPSNTSTSSPIPSVNCGYCGQYHVLGRRFCPAAFNTCKSCSNKGHFMNMCRKRNNGKDTSEPVSVGWIDRIAATETESF